MILVERAVVEQSGELDVRESAGDALAQLGIVQRVRVHRVRGGDHRLQVRRHRDREARGADPLVTERAHRDLPALAFAAEPAVHRDDRVGEPDFVEHRVAGDVTDRPGLDTGRLHVDDERGDALVLRAAIERGRVAAQQEEAPLREVRGGDPGLLPVHDVVVTVEDRHRAHVREVRAGLRLAEPLAPVDLGVQDPGEPALLLLGGTPLDDHRADLPDAVRVVDAGGAHPRHLLGVDRVLDRGGLPAVPVLRPVDGRPATVVQPALPVLALLLGPVEPGDLAPAGIVVGVPGLEELVEVRSEPVPQLVAERLVVGGEGEVHNGG